MSDLNLKSHGIDGMLIAGGGIYTFLAANLPVLVGLLTVVIFVYRIAIARQELKLGQKRVELLQKEIDKK